MLRVARESGKWELMADASIASLMLRMGGSLTLPPNKVERGDTDMWRALIDWFPQAFLPFVLLACCIKEVSGVG